MTKNPVLINNAAGRKVPEGINGIKGIPYKGIGKYRPHGIKAAPPIRSSQDYPASGNKVSESLKDALKKCGIKNGMRNGKRPPKNPWAPAKLCKK